MKKGLPESSPFLFVSLSALDLVALQASRADVIAHDFAFFDEGDLLDVRLEGSSRFAMAVADVVSGRLTFSANTANSRHIDTSAGINSTFRLRRMLPAQNEQRYNIISAGKKQSKSGKKIIFFQKSKKNFNNACKMMNYKVE